jgi:hypothetical protein
MNHLQACGYCDKYVDGGCSVFTEVDWVDRRGGCGMFPYREIPRSRGEYVSGRIVSGKNRPGQQKQKKDDRKYHSKNDGKRKYTFKF